MKEEVGQVGEISVEKEPLKEVQDEVPREVQKERCGKTSP